MKKSDSTSSLSSDSSLEEVERPLENDSSSAAANSIVLPYSSAPASGSSSTQKAKKKAGQLQVLDLFQVIYQRLSSQLQVEARMVKNKQHFYPTGKEQSLWATWISSSDLPASLRKDYDRKQAELLSSSGSMIGHSASLFHFSAEASPSTSKYFDPKILNFDFERNFVRRNLDIPSIPFPPDWNDAKIRDDLITYSNSLFARDMEFKKKMRNLFEEQEQKKAKLLSKQLGKNYYSYNQYDYLKSMQFYEDRTSHYFGILEQTGSSAIFVFGGMLAERTNSPTKHPKNDKQDALVLSDQLFVYSPGLWIKTLMRS